MLGASPQAWGALLPIQAAEESDLFTPLETARQSPRIFEMLWLRIFREQTR